MLNVEGIDLKNPCIFGLARRRDRGGFVEVDWM